MAYQTGRLPDTTPLAVDVSRSAIPFTIYFSSSAANRLVEISVDNGTHYFVPEYDDIGTTDSQIIVTIGTPISNVRYTGTKGDVWGTR